jgi:hypothetical protein
VQKKKNKKKEQKKRTKKRRKGLHRNNKGMTKVGSVSRKCRKYREGLRDG